MVKNPTRDQTLAVIAKSKHKAARRLVDPRTGDVWIWPAEDATHADGAKRLGIPYDKRPGEGEIVIG